MILLHFLILLLHSRDTMSTGETSENKCPHCTKTFSLKTNLNRHVKRLHGTLGSNGETAEVSKSMTCSDCGIKCRDNYQLKTHQRSHSKEKPFECSLCSYKSSRKEDVGRHMKKCRGAKYSCSNCGQNFTSKTAVTAHMNWDALCGNLGEQNVQQNVVKIAINKARLVIRDLTLKLTNTETKTSNFLQLIFIRQYEYSESTYVLMTRCGGHDGPGCELQSAAGQRGL